MRKKRIRETAEQRKERFEKQAEERIDAAGAADDAMDAMVRRSVKLHGP